MKNKSYVLLFIFLLIIPMVSAGDKLKLNIDIDSWIEYDETTNYSKFTIRLYGDERDLDIEDESTYTIENKTNWNSTITLRFDYSNETIYCSDDINNLTGNIIEICQTKTIELEDARKNVEVNKQACDTNLATCTTEKTDLKTKSDQYDSIKTNYDNCYTSLSNCTSVRDECQKSKKNSWWYIGIALALGGIIGFYGHDSIKKGFGRGRSSPEMRESPREIPDKIPKY